MACTSHLESSPFSWFRFGEISFEGFCGAVNFLTLGATAFPTMPSCGSRLRSATNSLSQTAYGKKFQGKTN